MIFISDFNIVIFIARDRFCIIILYNTYNKKKLNETIQKSILIVVFSINLLVPYSYHFQRSL